MKFAVVCNVPLFIFHCPHIILFTTCAFFLFLLIVLVPTHFVI